MKINFKHPKYVLPILAIPFLCLFFYVYSGSSSIKKTTGIDNQELSGQVGPVSSQMQDQELTGKLDAYRQRYKDTGEGSAISSLSEDTGRVVRGPGEGSLLTPGGGKSIHLQRQKQTVGNNSNASPPYHYAKELSQQDREMSLAISRISAQSEQKPVAEKTLPVPEDPMRIFRQQMAYMDSMSKATDPDYQKNIKEKEDQLRRNELRSVALARLLPVSKALSFPDEFNTTFAKQETLPIMAMIDEPEKGYLGSRIKIRLLEDIHVGKALLIRGSVIFAEISGFSAQRVKLSVNTVLFGNVILPVSLEVYDLDGLEGLYVPASSFREFSRDLGSSSVQGVSLQGNAAGSQEFIMSTIDKLFRSGSSAISGVIRKNKALLKYNTKLYLIDKSNKL